MKVATWNINGIRAHLDSTVTWLKDANPDILCLQEIKTEEKAFPTEAFEDLGYNVAIHGSNIVTGGYGRNTGTINDFISLRFNLDTGARDTTWGAPAFTDGKVLFDPTPGDNMAGSNCRNAVALPGGKTLLIGSSNRTTNNGGANPEVQDAVFAVLTATGTLDTSFGTGVNTYKLGDDGVEVIIVLAAQLIAQAGEDARVAGQQVEGKGQARGGRLVPGEEHCHQLVAQLDVVHRLALLVAGAEQEGEDVGALV